MLSLEMSPKFKVIILAGQPFFALGKGLGLGLVSCWEGWVLRTASASIHWRGFDTVLMVRDLSEPAPD
jgi:hypothetical protein